MDVVLCVYMSASSSATLVDKNGRVVCSETLQRAGCLPVLKQIVEEIAPKLMRRSQSRIVAASIAIQNNGDNANLKNLVGRHLRNDLHTNLGVRTFRVCNHSDAPLEDIAKATWKLV